LKDKRVYLRHILDEIEYISVATQSLTFTQFTSNDTLIRAITRSLEIIGEASRNVPDPIKLEYPDIPWKSMTGLRNRIIHGYFDINYDIVWDVITVKLPEIKPKIQEIVRTLESPAD
jgi:uncharacterized protein with HEPN domain